MTRSPTRISEKALTERKQFLTNLIRQKEEALKNAPRGNLRISRGRKKVQYYRRMDPKDRNGIYMRKSETEMILKLAQKRYDNMVLKSAHEELKAIEQYKKNLPVRPVEEILDSLAEEWQNMIHPIFETDAQFVANWLSVKYPPSPIEGKRQEFITDRGEIVRSKSELIIANYLYHHGIPYRYEYPLYLDGLGTIHPDFLILNVRLRKEIFWEHHGRMDDEKYAKRAVNRLNYYQINKFFPGDNLIFTMETLDTPISISVVKEMVNRYCL